MKNILFIILLFLPFFSIGNPDTLSQKTPITIWVSPDKNFPMQSVAYNQNIYLLTFDQATILSHYAAIGENSEKLIKTLENTDRINRLHIHQLNEQVQILLNSLHAAEMKYQLEKQKGKNKDTIIEMNDELIEAQEKEIKKQKRQKIIAIIVGGTLVVLSLLI